MLPPLTGKRFPGVPGSPLPHKPMRLPYLKVGMGGKVVSAPEPATLSISGPAVTKGIPFHPGGRVRLRLRWTADGGRPLPSLSWTSEDMVCLDDGGSGGRLQLHLVRPTCTPRLHVAGRHVAFSLQLFQGKTVPLPKYDLVFEDAVYLKGLTVRDRRRGGRRLWSLPAFLADVTWDGEHVWISWVVAYNTELLELRRLRDGAVLFSRDRVELLDECCGTTSLRFVGPLLACFCGGVVRNVLTDERLRVHALQGRQLPLGAGRTSCSSWSPTGDRVRVRAQGSGAFFEFTNRDGFAVPRQLHVPPEWGPPVGALVRFTPAREILWTDHRALEVYAWHHTRPLERRRFVLMVTPSVWAGKSGAHQFVWLDGSTLRCFK